MRRLALTLTLALVSCADRAIEMDGAAPSSAPVVDVPLEASALAPPIPVSAVVSAPSAAPPAPPEPPARCPAEPPVVVSRPALSDAVVLQALSGESTLPVAASIGEPSKGALLAGVELRSSEVIERSGKHAFGTELVVRSIERAAREVARCHPGAPKLHVGDLSREGGGWLSPHRSHQSGLDADIGFFYRPGSAWYVAPTKELLDAPRTWALLRAIIEGGGVEVVFLDLRVQRMLHDEAKAAPPTGWNIDDVFDLGHTKEKLLRHEPGHATHMHVRFTDPAARLLGARIVALDPTGAKRAKVRRAKPARPVGAKGAQARPG